MCQNKFYDDESCNSSAQYQEDFNLTCRYGSYQLNTVFKSSWNEREKIIMIGSSHKDLELL